MQGKHVNMKSEAANRGDGVEAGANQRNIWMD